MDEEAVVTIYSLKDIDVAGLKYAAAAEFANDNYGGKAICRDVLQFDLAPTQLAAEIDKIIETTPQLQKDLERYAQEGANYIFVAPIKGAPIWGRELVE